MKHPRGKKPATYDHRDLQFAHYRTTSVPLQKPPTRFGHEALVSNWGMLGNDQYGDCVFAGAAHETMLWNAERGITVPITAENALSDYGAVTGFTPDDPNSDQGTNVRDALDYRRQTGIVDATGARHKIAAYVALEPGNWSHVDEALYLFGAVGIGIEFPESAMVQFRNHKPWSVVHGAAIDGGHYVPLVAMRDNIIAVTWGQTQKLTKSFFSKYCDEAYAMLTEEMLTNGKTLEGFDLAHLQADLALL